VQIYERSQGQRRGGNVVTDNGIQGGGQAKKKKKEKKEAKGNTMVEGRESGEKNSRHGGEKREGGVAPIAREVTQKPNPKKKNKNVQSNEHKKQKQPGHRQIKKKKML